MLIFVSGCTARQATEPKVKIKRDLNFVDSKMQPKYMTKTMLEKIVTNFRKLLNVDFPHS